MSADLANSLRTVHKRNGADYLPTKRALTHSPLFLVSAAFCLLPQSQVETPKKNAGMIVGSLGNATLGTTTGEKSAG
jgi:hypothetical protein